MTKLSRISRITPLGLLLVAAPALVAQVTTGQISGRVTNSDNKPLRAKVVLTAPQLMGQREVLADANGEWRALLLPPGNYSIRISADGYVGSTIRNFRIGIGSALRRDSVLKPIATASTTVEIVGTETVVADKTDTKTAISFSADSLAQMTGGRDFGMAAALSVGVVSNGGYSIRGGQANSTIIRLDGADIKDPLQNELTATWYVADSIEEVAVVLSPLNARYGRTLGGSMDVVTKSGGNEFSGTMRVNAGRNSWSAEGRSYRGYTFDSANSRSRDFTLGGPIIKDRLWFTFAFMQQPNQQSVYRTANPDRAYMRAARAFDGANSNGVWHDGINNLTAIDQNTLLVAGTAAPQIQGYYFPYPINTYGNSVTHGYPTWVLDQQRQSDITNSMYSAKLTYGINQDHKITIGGQYQANEWKNSYIRYTDAQSVNSTFGAQGFNFSYNGILGSRTFAEVKFNRQKQWNDFIANDGTDAQGPVILLNLDNSNPNAAKSWYFGKSEDGYLAFLGKNWDIRDGGDERNNVFSSVNLTMYRDFWGMNHNIDTGLEYFQAEYIDTFRAGRDNNITYVGGVYQNSQGEYLFPALKWVGGGMWGQGEGSYVAYGLAPYRRQYFGDTGAFQNTNISLYFNDQMTINDHWNIMLGLRYDKADSKNINGNEVFSTSDLSPRFVLTYDLKGDSAHVFKFNYSRMQSDYQLMFARLFIPTGMSSNLEYGWTGAALPGGQPDPGTLGDLYQGREMYGLRFVTLSDLANPANWGNPQNFTSQGAQNLRDPHLKPMVNNEFALEYRRSFQGGSYVRTAYVYRVQSNVWTGRSDYNADNWVTVPDPTNTGLRPRYASATYYFNTTDLWRDYHGLEFESVTKINSILSLNINYSYSRLRGNNELSGGGDGAASYYAYESHLKDVPIEQRSPGGALNNDLPHTTNVGLLAVVPLDTKGAWISYSFIVGYDSGNNWNATYAAPLPSSVQDTYSYYNNLYNTDSTKPAPPSVPTTWTKWYAARGAYHTNDSYWATAAISWEVPIWKRVKTMGSISINNVFNTIYHYDYNRDTEDAPNGSNTWNLKSDRFGGYKDANGNLTYTNSPRSVNLSIGLKF